MEMYPEPSIDFCFQSAFKILNFLNISISGLRMLFGRLVCCIDAVPCKSLKR